MKGSYPTLSSCKDSSMQPHLIQRITARERKIAHVSSGSIGAHCNVRVQPYEQTSKGWSLHFIVIRSTLKIPCKARKRAGQTSIKTAQPLLETEETMLESAQPEGGIECVQCEYPSSTTAGFALKGEKNPQPDIREMREFLSLKHFAFVDWCKWFALDPRVMMEFSPLFPVSSCSTSTSSFAQNDSTDCLFYAYISSLSTAC